MKSKYLMIISFDAVSSEDLNDLDKLPNFKYIIEKGAYIKRVESVYPTLTYPAHTSIVTGKYPKNHGVIDNTLYHPGDLSPSWYWYKKYIKGDTIMDIASQKGMTTCAILWPVTGGAKIDYNFPEIFPVKWYHNQILMSLHSGSPLYQYRLNKKYGHLRKGIEQPFLDNFVMKCVEDTMENLMPELIMAHFADVDTNKHLHGVKSKEVEEALKRQDERLGKILEILRKKNILDDTDLIVLGDHAAKDVNKIIKINKLLVDKGYINISKNGSLLEYDVYCKGLDGGAYIYLKNPENEKIKKAIEKVLKDFAEKSGAIEYIADEEKIKQYGADLNASFMLEAKEGYYFLDNFTGEVIEDINKSEVGKVNHIYRAVHGYAPRRDDYKTFFVGFGKDFKEGMVINSGKIINHGPTIAKLLGGVLKDCDGEVEYDVFA